MKRENEIKKRENKGRPKERLIARLQGEGRRKGASDAGRLRKDRYKKTFGVDRCTSGLGGGGNLLKRGGGGRALFLGGRREKDWGREGQTHEVLRGILNDGEKKEKRFSVYPGG